MSDILAIPLICLAIHVCIDWEGYPLHWAKKYLMQLPTLIGKPLGLCLPCMGSIYTLGIFVVRGWSLDFDFLLSVLAVVGVNTIFALFFRLIEAVENLEQFDK